MYKLIIVEDEEAAREHLSLIIRRKFPEFSIIAELENGRECLDFIEKEKPHIIITDIRMPVMDGLELVAELSSSSPEIKTLVVSGYEDFEYARETFRLGVEDYLLKPVKIEKLGEILTKLSASLSVKILEDVIIGGIMKEEADKLFRVAMYRRGGHVSRFFPGRKSSDNFNENGITGIQGRDSNEWLLLCSPGDFNRKEFSERVSDIFVEDSTGYETFAVHEEPVKISELNTLFKALCSLVDRSIKLGKRVVVNYGQESKTPTPLPELPLKSLEYALSTENEPELRKIIAAEIESLADTGASLIMAEKRIKELFRFIQKEWATIRGSAERIELDISLELLLAESSSYETLNTGLNGILSELLGANSERIAENPMPVFFKAVCRYVENNYMGKISIGDLGEMFNLSESYLAKLFRKHLSCSFTDFVKHCRVTAAKELISRDPHIAIQDAALLCGFDDQFYFSKVFKQVSGISPTQFKKDLC